MKKTSYTGRYLDSIFDFIILIAIWSVSTNPLWSAILAFFCLQIQGTLYNYYYVILRHHSHEGVRTGKIFETSVPDAYQQESQAAVNALFNIYRLIYSTYDKIIYALARISHTKEFFLSKALLRQGFV